MSEYKNDQESCFGDYYQWGRLSDGHEKKDSMATSSGTISTITPSDNKFIAIILADYAWSNADPDGSLRESRWNVDDGTFICPIGYRIPTQTELENETVEFSGTEDINIGKVKVTNRDTGFKTF